MAIPGYTGTRVVPYVRALLPRTPYYRPSLGFTGLKSVPLQRNRVSRPLYHPDFGLGVIRDTVKKKGDPANVPLRRRVRCIRERDGKVVGETWSNATTGAYVFTQLPVADRYTVLAYDHEHQFRAAVADNLTAVIEP